MNNRLQSNTARSAALGAALFITLATLTATAAGDDVDLGFDSFPSDFWVGIGVTSMAVQPDGKILIGG